MTAPTPTRSTRCALAAAERRQAIFNAALLEFAHHGFARARLDDVARRAGVAKGPIYLLDRDKQELLKQVTLWALDVQALLAAPLEALFGAEAESAAP